MISPPVYRFIPNSTLQFIETRAEREGFPAAIRAVLNLPDLPLNAIKDAAHRYYVNGPSSVCDPFLLVRAWIKGFEFVWRQDVFVFEIDQYIKDLPLTKKPDNPK